MLTAAVPHPSTNPLTPVWVRRLREKKNNRPQIEANTYGYGPGMTKKKKRAREGRRHLGRRESRESQNVFLSITSILCSHALLLFIHPCDSASSFSFTERYCFFSFVRQFKQWPLTVTQTSGGSVNLMHQQAAALLQRFAIWLLLTKSTTLSFFLQIREYEYQLLRATLSVQP